MACLITFYCIRPLFFEQVIVGDERLRIQSIIALDQETAKNYRWSQ